MSYNDYDNRLEGYGDRRRNDEYGERRYDDPERRDDYGSRRTNDRDAPGDYGGSRSDDRERRDDYGSRRFDDNRESRDNYGERSNDARDRREDYDERRHDDRDRRDNYGERRQEGGGYGEAGDTRREAEPGYGERRQELREHGASGYGSGHPVGDLSYGSRRPDDPLYGGGGSQGDNYYDQSNRFDDEPNRRTGAPGGDLGGQSGGRFGGGSGGRDEYSIANSGTSNAGSPLKAVGAGSSYDFSGAETVAYERAGSSGDRSLFGTALSLLSGKKQSLEQEDVDEDDAVRQHKQFYGGGGQVNSQASSGNLGAAAAMQALKMFTGGQQDSSGGSSGGNSQNQFIGMAMAHAAELFDKESAQGHTQPDANKQDVVASAAQMALKMYLKSQMGGGNANSGGGGLMSLASKFL